MSGPLVIDDFMTNRVHGINPAETLQAAQQRMESLGIRHLPVRDADKVVGVLSERDLYVLRVLGGVDFTTATVGFAMSRDPYCVAPGAHLAAVAGEMERRRIGSAVVVDANARVLGIFTDTDALRALATLAL